MTYILGISAFFHDSAAALVKDGEIVAAAQEERFSRCKHDAGFPRQAIDYCLREAGIAAGDLAAVAFYEKPLVKFHRLMETYAAYAPQGYPSFRLAMPQWVRVKLDIPRTISRRLGGYDGPILFPEHHESHAAAAFYPSPFARAAILTIDGVGEWTTASIGVGDGHRLALRERIRFPHSLGLLYSAFTYYLGFQVNSGEYKVMGLAPYGDRQQAADFARTIKKYLIDLKPDGSFCLNLEFFNYCQGLTMTHRRFDRLFGGPPRSPGAPVGQREMDLAAAIQQVTEEVMTKMARRAAETTGETNLCMAGGVALNCVGNGLILARKAFERCFFQPASGDAGGALGAALLVWHQLMGNPREVDGVHDAMRASLLGPAFDTRQIAAFTDKIGAQGRRFDSEDELLAAVSSLLQSGKVVGLFNGRMEFGPRALGARSILGDPRNPQMQSVMNLKIKFRESFRPFAPIVLEEDAEGYFDLTAPSPYMLRVGHVLPERRLAIDNDACLGGLERLKAPRSEIPAVTHVDYSARVQTVDRGRHPRLHRLLSRFKADTGCPVLVNTSFNVRGEPIVCTPADAYRCFMNTHMDALLLGDRLFLKEEQSPAPAWERERYRDGYLAADEDEARDAHEHAWRSPAELWRQPAAQTRRFGGVFLLGTGLIGLLRFLLAGDGPGSWGDGAVRLAAARPWWLVGVAVGLGALALPKLFRPVYVLWMLLGQTIGRVVLEIMLATTYFMLLTPVALLYRRWRSPIVKKPPRKPPASYWESCRQPAGNDEYYRTF